MDFTTARAHHDAAGMQVGKDLMEGGLKAAREQENARQKGGADRRDKTDRAECRSVRRRL